MMKRGVPGFTRVRETPEELADYKRKHFGSVPVVYRIQCDDCGARIWGGGLGIGSHRRACKGAPP